MSQFLVNFQDFLKWISNLPTLKSFSTNFTILNAFKNSIVFKIIVFEISRKFKGFYLIFTHFTCKNCAPVPS